MKDNRWKQLSAILDEVEVYGRAIGKVDFDMQCVAPPEGLEQAGEDEAVLGKRMCVPAPEMWLARAATKVLPVGITLGALALLGRRR